jgi:hypothetical protein
MHQWIDPSPVDEPMPRQEKQPRAIDARTQWIEPDTMHQWDEAGPVTEDLPQGGGPDLLGGRRKKLLVLAKKLSRAIRFCFLSLYEETGAAPGARKGPRSACKCP